jgi:lipopolysaccharide biosynthesis regulator YciM
MSSSPSIRNYVGLLLGLVTVFYLPFLVPLNFELLVEERFQLNSETSIPVYVALLVVFFSGLLPPLVLLLIDRLKRDLAQRRNRRRLREVDSLDQRFRRAVDLHIDGQGKKAAAELEILLTERPDDFATLLRYGEVLRHQGRTEEALEAHRRASSLYPRSVALLYQLAEDYEAVGQPDVGREIRNRILRDFPDSGLGVMRRRRDAAMVSGEWGEAVRWHEKVENLLRDGGDSAALKHEEGISRGLSYQRGVARLEKDRTEEAVLIFRRLLEVEPRFVPAGIMLGEAELLMDNQEAALDEWKRGFKVTGSSVFLQRIEDHFIESEEPARAIETLRALIAQAENDLLPRFFLGRLYYRLEMHTEAAKILRDLGEQLDPSPTYHYLLGRICQRREDSQGAVTNFLTCLNRLGVSNVSFVCQICQAHYDEWHDRCQACGAWNSVDLDVEEQKLTAEELGVTVRPVWGGYVALEDTQMIETVALG